MKKRRMVKGDRRRAFTLIELLVVVSIIALLIAILVPSLNSARRQAKNAASRASIQGLGSGLETFKADTSVGGAYAPSGSDKTDNKGQLEPNVIASPLKNDANQPLTMVSGANLLVFAMMGADLLKTPGFQDFNRNGTWWDDMHRGTNGAYERDATTGEAKRPRVGPFCSDAMTKDLSSVANMEQAGLVKNPAAHPLSGSVEMTLPFFVDAFKNPILYYRARRSASFMVTDPGAKIGVYDHRDNQFLTGTGGGVGVHFNSKSGHLINGTSAPDATGSPAPIGFSRYILDDKVTARPTPVMRETFLLISPGYDGIYGNSDDITNWTK